MITQHTQGRLTIVMNSTSSAAWPELHDAAGCMVAELDPSHVEKRPIRGSGGFNDRPDRFYLDQYGPRILADAIRLAACWNACDGVPTEVLGAQMAGGLPWSVADQLDKLADLAIAERQRDELLRAIERIAGLTLSQFSGPHSMANECCSIAIDAVEKIKGKKSCSST